MSPNPELLNQQNGNVAEGLLGQVTILGERGGLIDAMVPAHLIKREEVPVNEEHVRELAKSILEERRNGNGTGQVTALALGIVPDEIQFVIMDGFHRESALHLIGAPEYYSTIRQATREQVLDYRIRMAVPHQSVAFPRVVEWITGAWSSSEWADKLDISQALNMTAQGTSGRNLGLTSAEAQAISEWVSDKCAKWQLSESTVRAYLATAGKVDPSIVRLVRPAEKGKFGFVQGHVDVLSRSVPDLFGVQQLVTDLTLQRKLSPSAMKALVNRVRRAPNLGGAVDIVNGLSQADWRTIQGTAPRRKSAGPRRTATPGTPSGSVLKPVAEPEVPTAPVSESPLFEEPRNAQNEPVSGAGASPHPGAVPAEVVFYSPAQTRDMAREILLTDIELGLQSLRTLVLSGAYNVPAAGAVRMNDRTVTVPANDREVSGLLRPTNEMDNIRSFLTVRKDVEPKLLERLGPQGGRILQEVTRLVTEDIREGDLRFVTLTAGVVSRELLVQTVRQEVGRRRSAQDGHMPVHAPEIVPLSTPVPLEALVQSVPTMNRQARRAIVLRAVLGLSTPTTAAILGHDIRTLPVILRTGADAVLRNTSKLAARLPREVPETQEAAS